MMQQYGQHGMRSQQPMMNMNQMGGFQHGGMRGFGLMNLATDEATKPAAVETLAKKAEEPAKPAAATELTKKAAPKKVTAASPGTKKVMEEISFEKPTWKDQKGFGWADFPYAGGFAAAPEFGFGFETPFAGYAAPEFGFAGYETPFAAPEFGYAGFEAPFYGDLGYAPEFGFGGFEAPFAAPYGDFGLGAPFAAPFAPEFGGFAGFDAPFAPEYGAYPYAGYAGFEEPFYGERPMGVWDGFDAAPFLAVPNYSWKK